jgi:hypothetical protein
MAINERAKFHYDKACKYLDDAVASESVNDAIKLTGFAEAALKLAQFCVDNHALVAGIDEDAPLNPQDSRGGPRLWGGPPVPQHIQQAEQTKREQHLQWLEENRRIRNE